LKQDTSQLSAYFDSGHSVVYLPFEDMELMPFRLRFGRIFRTIPYAVALSIVVSVMVYIFTDWYWMLVVWSVGFVFQLLVLSTIIGRWNRFRIHKKIKRERNKALSALLRIPFQNISATSYESRVSCVEDIRSAHSTPVISIVDAACQASIENIEIADEFIEPDSLGVGGLTRWGCSSVFALITTLLFVWVILVDGVKLGADNIVVWLIAIGVLIVGFWQTPIRGKIHRVFNRSSVRNIIGPGFFAHSVKHRWTVDDSIMVVGVKGIEVYTEIIVVLVGPAGAKHLRFNSAQDVEFARLWKYWNHPAPRTELLDSLF